jgi:hypothetical protein
VAAGSIVLDLLMRTGSFETDTDRAAKRLKKFEREAQASATAVRGALSGMLAGAAGAFGIGAVSRFVKETVDGIDALNDFAEAYGVTIERASALDDLARRNGESLDTFGTAIERLNKALAEGGRGAEVLERLGLSADELRRLAPDEQLERVARAFAKYADDGKKAQALQVLFSGSAKDVARLMKDLAEAGERQGSVTKQQAEQAKEFNDQLAALDANFTKIGRSLVGDALPALTLITERFVSANTATQKWVETLLLLSRLNPLGGLTQAVRDRMGLADVAPYGNEGRNYPQPSLGDGAPPAWMVDSRAIPATPWTPPKAGRSFGSRTDSALDRARGEIEKWLQLQERVSDDGTTGGITAVIDEMERGANAARAAVEKWVEAERNMVADDGTTAGIQAVIDHLAERTDKLSDAARDMGFAFNDALNGIILDFDRADEYAKRFLQNIAGTLLQKYVTGPAADGFTGFIDGLITGKRADGGPVMGGSTYLVGERGPELFTPRTSGAIIPNGAFGGGGVSVQVINNGSPVQARVTTERGPDGRQLVKLVLDAVADDIGRGGVTAQALKSRGLNLGGNLPRRA